MGKMKTDTKKIAKVIGNIIVFVFIFLFVFSNIFSRTIGDLDEIWNYNFAKNISNGLIPYKDFNMIQTPLLSMICALFLKIICDKLIVMRVLAVIMQTVIFYLGYHILKKYSKNDGFSLIIIIALLIIFRDIFSIDYNYGVLLIALICLIIELRHLNKVPDYFKVDFKYNILIGILVGVAVLFKHTTGIILCLGVIGYKIFEIRSKDDFKSFIKIALIRLLGTIVPITIFILYLILTKSFMDFISYCILGVRHFTNAISYSNLFGIKYVKVLAIIIPISMLILFILQIVKNNKMANILFGYSLASFAVAFPISDKIHFMIGSYICLIGIGIFLIQLVDNSLETEKDKKIKLAILTFTSIFLLLFVGYKSIIKIEEDYIKKPKETQLNHFEGIVRNDSLRELIFEIDDYILEQEKNGNKVLILDADAAIYFIPLDKYNKNYDMFLIGNLGKSGEDGIIEEMKDSHDYYLVKLTQVNWQTPMKARDYVINNKEVAEEKSIFYVFK